MDTAMTILAVILGAAGIVGSIVPGLPGPPLSWAGLLLMYFFGGTDKAGESMSLTFLLVWLGVTIAVTVADYFIPALLTKATGGTRYGSRGAIIGLVAGMIFTGPVGMIACSLAGAFIFELIYGGKGAGGSLKSAFGAFLGFLSGTGIKLIASALMLYYIIIFV